MKPPNGGILALLSAPALATARDLITDIPGFGPQPTPASDGCTTDPDAFGGVAGCIPASTMAPPVETGCPSDPNGFGGVAGCIPISQTLSSSAVATLIPLTGTVTATDGNLPTITVTWTASDITLTTTANGAAVPSPSPVWVCVGPSCNPDCTVPATGCTNQDTPGVNGFPWPQPPIGNPPPDTGASVGDSTPQPSTTQPSTTDNSQTSITTFPAASFSTTGFVTTTQNGQTTVVPVVVPVGGGSGGSSGGSNGGSSGGGPPGGGPPGGGPPGGGPPGGGGGGNGDPNDPNKSNNPTSTNTSNEPTSTSTSSGCQQTTVQCTQVCSVSSTQANAPATTACAPNPVCKRQAGQCDAGGTQTATATTTTFTTISTTGQLCGFENCGAASTFCPLIPATAGPTNSPGAQIPTATDFPASPPAPPAKGKRAPGDILSNDFLDPNTFPGGRNTYYSNMEGLIDTFGPQNAGDGVSRGLPSSRQYSIFNLNQPFITGSGPSWGCTSLLVFSDKGMFVAHFWETDNIRDPAGFQSTLNFLNNGSPDFPSLGSVANLYFGNDALFVKAIIWTPNEVRPRADPSFPDRTGKVPTDAVWYPQVDDLKTRLGQIVPRLNQIVNNRPQISTVTYSVFTAQEQLAPTFPPEQKLLGIEYVPGYIRQAGQCTFSRAIRIHNQGIITPPIAWSWPQAPAAPAGPSKRQDGGSCPANINALLSAQAPDNGDVEFFTFPDPATSPPPSSTIPAAPSATQESSTTAQPSTTLPPVPVPTTMATSVIKPGPTLCANLQFLPGGGSVGSNCNGDPNLTVTFPPVRRRSLPTPAP